MEKRLSYIVVGIFVITLTLSLFAFLFWLAKYGNKTIEHDYYTTYFEESVSGLNIESLVKLRGVEVGRVKKISINKDNSEEVEVLLEIKKDTPIKEDTFTMLDSQGITGLKYIELKGGTKSSKKLLTSKEKISVIQSKKSVMSSLFDSSENITGNIEDVLAKIEILLNNKNIENISQTFDNLSTTMEYINNNKDKIGSLLVEMEHFLKHTEKFEDKLLPSVEKIGTMSDKTGAAFDQANTLFSGVHKELEKGEFSIATIVEENLKIVNEAALSVKNLSQKIEATVDELKNSPSDILYKSNEKILGPGESHD